MEEELLLMVVEVEILTTREVVVEPMEVIHFSGLEARG